MEKDSSIITSLHFHALDVRAKTAELPPIVKGFDGFFGTDCAIDKFEAPEMDHEQDRLRLRTICPESSAFTRALR